MERNIQEEILLLIKEGKFSELEDYHDNDIADVLLDLTKDERIKLYHALGIQRVSDIFSYLDEDVSEALEELGIDKAADIIELMDADDAVDVLEELDDSFCAGEGFFFLFAHGFAPPPKYLSHTSRLARAASSWPTYALLGGMAASVISSSASSTQSSLSGSGSSSISGG